MLFVKIETEERKMGVETFNEDRKLFNKIFCNKTFYN